METLKSYYKDTLRALLYKPGFKKIHGIIKKEKINMKKESIDRLNAVLPQIMASSEHKEWFSDPKDIKIVIVKNIEEVKDLIRNTEAYVLILDYVVEGETVVLTKSQEVLEILKDSESYNFEDYISESLYRIGELMEIDQKTGKEIITVAVMSFVTTSILLIANIYFFNLIVAIIITILMLLVFWLEKRAYKQILNKNESNEKLL